MSRAGTRKLMLKITSPAVKPHEMFALLRKNEFSFLLESGKPYGETARYSILGTNPFLTVKSKGCKTSVSYLKDKPCVLKGDPLGNLESLFDKYRESFFSDIPFAGGIVGYLGYNLNSVMEKKVKPLHPDEPSFPGLYFIFADSGAVYDHVSDILYIFAVPVVSRKRAEGQFAFLKSVYEKACKRLNQKKQDILKKTANTVRIKSLTDRKDYLESIKRAKKYISAGDIYEVNLSHRMIVESAKTPWDTYLSVRRKDPTPFASFLKFKGLTIVSASPERFLMVRGDKVETRPIKGTMPRGGTKTADMRMGEELFNSPKNRAENIMIVDLSRNDIGRVCDFGSVIVDRLMDIEGYSKVFQMVSTISGKLSKGRNVFDCIRACFPGGSMTGTPKIRAMQIIEELEPVRRGIYSGSLGYLSFNGSMDLNIIIRTLIFWRGKAYLQVGGAIVADSQPEKEYMETMYKAESLLEALK